MRELPRRLFALEAKAGQCGERICLFVLPDEDAAAALARTFGPSGAPPGARLTLFSWLPAQDSPP